MIREIGIYIPDNYIENDSLKEKFSVDSKFIEQKIGFRKRSIASQSTTVHDLCLKSFESLSACQHNDVDDIGLCLVITQNPDNSIPHTSALLHKSLGLKSSCACFDISLGCSGYVYALSIAKLFMKAHGICKGLIFTCDPYSKIVDTNDKNTSMLFGDAASVTVLDSVDYRLDCYGFDFGTYGALSDALKVVSGQLVMNGRAVFNFTTKHVPDSIARTLVHAGLTKDAIEGYFLHQGSRAIVDALTEKMDLNENCVYFDSTDYGNTVSSSIPILISGRWNHIDSNKKYICSGFGVGLSWASCVLES